VQYGNEGLTFDVAVGGPEGGRPVVLLHGFPQDSSSWDRVVPFLHEAGCRTYRPDQRGYSPGASPEPVPAYEMSHLVGDVVALLDAAGIDRVHLVGHDWGGGVAWAVAGASPGRVATLTVLSTPHPAALAWAFQHTRQLFMSWYMGMFQVPAIPELFLSARFRQTFAGSGMSPADAARYARRFSTRASLRGPVNWYRASGLVQGFVAAFTTAVTRGHRPPPAAKVTVPTTYVWGTHDVALGRAAAERTARYVAAPYAFVELDASHWLPEERPEDVAREILARMDAID
jgi:pimeloyl-ACP methyl ester carboxylesterase